MFINMFLWFSGAFLQILGVLRYVIEHKMNECMPGEAGDFERIFLLGGRLNNKIMTIFASAFAKRGRIWFQ